MGFRERAWPGQEPQGRPEQGGVGEEGETVRAGSGWTAEDLSSWSGQECGFYSERDRGPGVGGEPRRDGI